MQNKITPLLVDYLLWKLKKCCRPVCFAALAAIVVAELLDQRAHFTSGGGSLTGVTNTLAVDVLEVD